MFTQVVTGVTDVTGAFAYTVPWYGLVQVWYGYLVRVSPNVYGPWYRWYGFYECIPYIPASALSNLAKTRSRPRIAMR